VDEAGKTLVVSVVVEVVENVVVVNVSTLLVVNVVVVGNVVTLLVVNVVVVEVSVTLLVVNDVVVEVSNDEVKISVIVMVDVIVVAGKVDTVGQKHSGVKLQNFAQFPFPPLPFPPKHVPIPHAVGALVPQVKTACVAM